MQCCGKCACPSSGTLRGLSVARKWAPARTRPRIGSVLTLRAAGILGGVR
jgi:hypothetical protein